MTPLVEERIGRQGTPEFDALGLARRVAHHVRQLVQAARRAQRVTERPPTARPSSTSSAASARTASSRDAPSTTTLVARVLDAATCAPSAENRQPWVFVVVRDDDVRADDRRPDRARVGRRRARVRGSAGSRPASSPRSTTASRAAATATAPVRRRGRRRPRTAASTQTVASSIFPATQNLLLAASALGLGSALTTLDDRVRRRAARAARPARATSSPRPSSRSATRPVRSASPRREPGRRAHPPRALRHPLVATTRSW